jgi:hypothetical protein
MAVIWGKADKKILGYLNKVVKQCARLVCTKKRYESVKSDISGDLKWLMPEALYRRSVLLHMYRIMNCSEAPVIWKEQFTRNIDVHSHNTRQRENLHHPYKPRTSAGEKTFIFNGYSAWNDLTEEERKLTYFQFKTAVTEKLISANIV